MEEYKPFYFLCGEDDFRKEEFIKNIIYSLLGKKNLSLNLYSHDAKEINIQNAIDIAHTLPLLSRHRVVIIYNIEFLKEEQAKALIQYCNSPNANTCLMLVTNKPKVPEEFSGFFSSVKKFGLLSNEELLTWIREKLKGSGLTIEPDAIELIVEFLGNNLRIVASELEKLITYIGRKSHITRLEVQNLLGSSIQKTAFDFINSLLKEDITGALTLLHNIHAEIQKYPPRLLGLICWNFKQVLRIKDFINAGKNEYEISRLIRIPRKNLPELIRYAKQMNTDDLTENFKLLMDLDLKLKRSRITPHVGYEILSTRLLSKSFV
ncbi:MAG: DNA polymerase III subunit delta [Candidatus Omnitrophota bacterium]